MENRYIKIALIALVGVGSGQLCGMENSEKDKKRPVELSRTEIMRLLCCIDKAKEEINKCSYCGINLPPLYNLEQHEKLCKHFDDEQCKEFNAFNQKRWRYVNSFLKLDAAQFDKALREHQEEVQKQLKDEPINPYLDRVQNQEFCDCCCKYVYKSEMEKHKKKCISPFAKYKIAQEQKELTKTTTDQVIKKRNRIDDSDDEREDEQRQRDFEISNKSDSEDNYYQPTKMRSCCYCDKRINMGLLKQHQESCCFNPDNAI